MRTCYRWWFQSSSLLRKSNPSLALGEGWEIVSVLSASILQRSGFRQTPSTIPRWGDSVSSSDDSLRGDTGTDPGTGRLPRGETMPAHAPQAGGEGPPAAAPRSEEAHV